MTETTVLTPTDDRHYIATIAYGAIGVEASEYRLRALIKFETREEAEAYGAKFPKSLRVKAGPMWSSENRTGGYVSLDVTLKATGANGGVNESGIARAAKFLTKAHALGTEAVYVPTFSNSLPYPEVVALLGL